MEAFLFTAIVICALIFIPPVILLRPLILAIAHRISDRKGDANEIKELRQRVSVLESELSQVNVRILQVEDTHDFVKKMESHQANKLKS